ncbi:MAG: sulfurtransferase TusA family protein [Planctomycetes bacterium]|nr:sulfurtransferase TusA family protein [Planctomycetota bacterium]
MDEIESERAEKLVAWLAERTEAPCATCARALCSHELLFAYALGFRTRPVCSACAARELAQADVPGLRQHLRAHFARRSCFSAAWAWSDAREPDCSARSIQPVAVPVSVTRDDGLWVDAEWDAGDLGCGDLVLELRGRLAALAAGEVLELRATDPGAPEDLPAWCAMTGHTLLSAVHPRYRIRRRP